MAHLSKKLIGSLMKGVLLSSVLGTGFSHATIIEHNIVIDIPQAGFSSSEVLLTNTPLSPFTVENGDTVRINAQFSGGRRIEFFNDPVDGIEFLFGGIYGDGSAALSTGRDSGMFMSLTGVQGAFNSANMNEQGGSGGHALGIFVIDNLTNSSFLFSGLIWELSNIGPVSGLPAEFNEFHFNPKPGLLTIHAATVPEPGTWTLASSGLFTMIWHLKWKKRTS